MITEEQKAINHAKFIASKADKLDEEVHQLDMQLTRLKIELIATEKRRQEAIKESYLINKKLRKMIIEI